MKGIESMLHREDFGLGPISYNCIEPNLYLGSLSAAKDIDTLNKLKITHIITIDTCPLPRNILELSHITNMFIQLPDFPKEDLLSHLDNTDVFIKEGLEKGAVLVHCYFGISRSATVVIGYIMKKHRLTYQRAFETVKAKRSIVFPNQGFVSQLKLYQEMDYTINKSSMRYKIFRLNMAAERVRKVKILPQNFMDLIQPDPGLPQTQPHPNVYRCKKCRRVLASENNLIVHQENGKKCIKTYFLEPISWMDVTQTLQGKLHCPKCKHKVGSFSWIMGCQCPCGVQVAPAFYLVPSKVDYTNVVKNVEMTF
ncbi:dual specificity protein phosphatase MPK-4 [Anthonomus grandis grandis]|uniref:dual specificity protein phosphatase MPK-4 n=1 Tax=Anthonomus grandis grandis TaxID=2921223 RepID=UPI002166AC0F|nr:dual specificity protein phosphatase MPK-4 [Anthonomus grandis grandis]XP_050308983.1 dual specificity protein phosphatase MPK-4 [Anthonomus grandis grandis]